MSENSGYCAFRSSPQTLIVKKISFSCSPWCPYPSLLGVDFWRGLSFGESRGFYNCSSAYHAQIYWRLCVNFAVKVSRASFAFFHLLLPFPWLDKVCFFFYLFFSEGYCSFVKKRDPLSFHYVLKRIIASLLTLPLPSYISIKCE